MRRLLIVLAFTVVTTAASSCDPQTEYENNAGRCCRKCGPGTRMSSSANCLDPLCEQCNDREYQDGYTDKTKCDLQPYCDPHKNFAPADNQRKTQLSPCTCKLGYHCSSVACLTCVQHTTCKPGHWAKFKGNHTQDTVCEECPPGKFFSGTSEDGACKDWTVCESGSQIKTSGSATSDTVCEDITRGHWITYIIVIVICVVFLAVIGIVICKRTGNRGCTQGMVKRCMESCVEGPKEPEKEVNPRIANPMTDEHSLTSEMGTPQQEAPKTPEENEDEQTSQPFISVEKAFTENGNVVTQEDGKKEIISRQESHSLLTFSD